MPPYPNPAPSAQSTDLFFGADGLRPGWGLLLFSALFGLLYLIAESTALYLSPTLPGLRATLEPGSLLLIEGPFALAVLATTFILALVEGRPLASYGLRSGRISARLLTGAVSGLGLLSVLILTLRLTGAIAFTGVAIHGAAVPAYALAWLGTYLCVAFYEEMLFRGYLQATLTRALTPAFDLLGQGRSRQLAFWTSALILSVGFGVVHTSNPGESRVGELAAGLIGIVFCLSLYRSGSLWWAIGFHAAWDWAESYLYGVPDSGLLAQGHLLATRSQGARILSGGSTGPEGSILILPILLVMALLIVITLRPAAVDLPPASPM